MNSFFTQPTTDELYRFRSVESLVGEYKELYYQQIYLADPYELNDLTESVTDVDWKADEIVWSQFINYYWISLAHEEAGMPSIILPGYHLFSISPFQSSSIRKYVSEMAQLYSTQKTETVSRLVRTGVNQTHQIGTALKRLTPNRISRERASKFVTEFIRMVSKLPYTSGRVAAFTKDFTNPYMWAMYADNNQGVCLIYEKSELEAINDRNNYQYSVEIADIDYESSKPKINLFESLPTLTREAYKYLFTNDDGERSPLFNDFNDRSLSKSMFERKSSISRSMLLTKPKYWESEQEVRMFQMTRDMNKKVLITYPIRALKGVIFGARITDEGKNAILDVLRAKHVSKTLREDFQLCQARLKSDGSLDRVLDEYLIDWWHKYRFPQSPGPV